MYGTHNHYISSSGSSKLLSLITIMLVLQTQSMLLILVIHSERLFRNQFRKEEQIILLVTCNSTTEGIEGFINMWSKEFKGDNEERFYNQFIWAYHHNSMPYRFYEWYHNWMVGIMPFANLCHYEHVNDKQPKKLAHSIYASSCLPRNLNFEIYNITAET